MTAPTWGELAERAKVLVWHQVRALRRRYRRWRFEHRRSDLADVVKLQGIERRLERNPGAPIGVSSRIDSAPYWMPNPTAADWQRYDSACVGIWIEDVE